MPSIVDAIKSRIDRMESQIAELYILENENHEKQQNKFDLKLSNVENMLSGPLYSVTEQLLNMKESQDAEMNQLKAKIAELVKLYRKDEIEKEQKEKRLKQADKIKGLESKILELEKQIENLEKKATKAEVSDPYQFEVHAGAIVDSIRFLVVTILVDLN